MNAGIYKLIFSKRLNALVVVGEICSSQGKAPGTTRALKRAASGMVQIVKILGMLSSGALLASSAWATPAPDALPTGGQVAQGSASISQSGAQMDINQASQRAVINWQSFDVGANARVHVIQPNQAAVLLNRVVTNKPSEIYGKIDANGQVILVNANGIIFGKDGSASASSFTATTLDISDKDFMEGKTRFSSNGAQGEIVNHGTIEAKDGGYVALLGAKVTNDGKIITHNGTVALGAADSIAIPMTSSGKIKMELSAGSINAAVENTKNGVIVTEGGDVYLQAAAANNAMASITNSGQIDTSGEQAGKAILLADNGEIKVDGSITANSSNAANKGGDIIIGRDQQTGVLAKATDVSGARLESKKGFVETSGEELKFDGVSVIAKDWLLDPQNVTINAVDAATIGTNLGTTSITIQTTGATLGTTSAGTGNITINNAITKAAALGADTTLTLLADNGITVNADIGVAAGAGKLNLVMTAKGQTDGVAVGSMTAAQKAGSQGVKINGVNINANAGNISITGTSYVGTGNVYGIHNSGTITGGSVSMVGNAAGTNNIPTDNNAAVYSSGAITSTVAGISIKGTNSNASTAGGAGTRLEGKVTAKGDINLEGYSSSTNPSLASNQGVAILNAVESASGNITVKAQTNAGAQRALVISTNDSVNYGSLKVANGHIININANTLYLEGTKSFVNAGTGTVNIKTLGAENEILIGGSVENDVKNSTLASQKLGIDNTELNRITAGTLVIGDKSSTGKITVAAATTTNASTGHITLQTGGSILVDNALTVGDSTGTKNLILDAGGAIENGANGKLTATDLTLKAGSTIGSTTQAIKTKVNKVSLTSAGNQFLVEDDGVTVAAKTTGNGNINITTTNGTMTVGIVNVLSGINAGTGNVDLTATSNDSHGVFMPSDVIGKDITMNAKANNATGLGFYGSGGSFKASGSLNLTGTATGVGNGFYSYSGSLSAGTGIVITGTSTNGQGVGFDAKVNLTNTTGDIVVKGTANGANTEGIGFRGVLIQNEGGKITLEAAKGQIYADTGNLAWGLGVLSNTIFQKGAGDVKLTTVGDGNITVPLIVNNGTGNVVIAAGSDLAAGNGDGGQVKPVAGNSVNNTHGGKLYVYSGSATKTGTLSNLDSTNFNELYLDSLSSDGHGGFVQQNAESNVAFMTGATRTTIASGATAQVLFREKVSINQALNGATLNTTYGDVNTANGQATGLWTDVQNAMKANNATNLTSTMSDANNNNVKFHISATTVIDSMTGTNDTAAYSSSGYLKANAANGNTGYVYRTGNDKYTIAFKGGADGVVKVDVGRKDVSVVSDGKTVVYNGLQQTDTVTRRGFIDGDKVGTVVGAGTGSSVGSYESKLKLVGDISDLSNYNVVYGDTKLVIADATGGDPLLNPVPVNPDYKSPNSSAGGANELVTTQQNNEQIQKQCSLEFAKECKVRPASVQEIAPRYMTFY